MAVLTLVASTQDLGSEASPATGTSVLRLVLGIALLGFAAKTWRSRPAPGEDPAEPSWMAKTESMRPSGSFVFAVFLGGVNPKNLVMNIAAAVVLASADLSPSSSAAAIALYTAVASSTVAMAVGYRIFRRERAVATLGRMRGWLIANNAAVMGTLFLVLGAKLVGDALL